MYLTPEAKKALEEASESYGFDPDEFLSFIVEMLTDEDWEEYANEYMTELEGDATEEEADDPEEE
jgi:hypothetical protein